MTGKPFIILKLMTIIQMVLNLFNLILLTGVMNIFAMLSLKSADYIIILNLRPYIMLLDIDVF